MKQLFGVFRAVSVTVFAGQILTLAVVTAGVPGWATWRRFGLGWRFWIGLADEDACVALGCLLGCLVLSPLLYSQKVVGSRPLVLVVLLNLITLGLWVFVPAIAGV